ncbi:MAG TPA: alpha/beta fold hydrolase [Vicinamibacterales bacterium]|nr:alpha/beta fold hydrolase [Vicinamibacterales bacterium]
MSSGHFMSSVQRTLCAVHLLAALTLSTAAAAQDTYRVFLGGAPLGSEQMSVARSPEGWTIRSSGQLGAPLEIVTRQLEITYDPDWKPLAAAIDGTIRNQVFALRVAVEGKTAKTHVFQNGRTIDKDDTIAADAVLLPNLFFAGYVALAQRLRTAEAGATLHAYIPGQASIDIPVGASSTQHIQTVNGLVVARRTSITLTAGGAPLDADVWSDANGRFLRLTVPAQSLDVVREDLASVSSRVVTISRPNDEQVKFGDNGVTLAGTVSKPKQAAAGKLPAVVLVSGSGPHDRDSVVFGIPIMGQMADALADAGYLVLRYDKRGNGQSGGRPDTAALADYAEDLRAAVHYLADRKDVDPKRIAVVGHSEGGAVALMAAEKDKRIAAVALLAANGVSGSELVLAQQRHLLDRLSLTPEQKQERIDLQKKINDAAVTGKGIEQLPANVRGQVTSPEFQSLLANDPEKIVPKVKQPILIVQGELDTQVDPSNADRLEQLAKSRKKESTSDEVKLPGVNHLLVPAKTGEVDEYATLQNAHVSPAVTEAIVSWLNKTLTAR